MIKCTRKARKIAKKAKATIFDARQMLSYAGWLSHSQTYNMYLKWVKPYIDFKKLKCVVSKHDRRKLLCSKK
jgi:hypothetical protein